MKQRRIMRECIIERMLTRVNLGIASSEDLFFSIRGGCVFLTNTNLNGFHFYTTTCILYSPCLIVEKTSVAFAKYIEPWRNATALSRFKRTKRIHSNISFTQRGGSVAITFCCRGRRRRFYSEERWPLSDEGKI